jgi:hypothetical protein
MMQRRYIALAERALKCVYQIICSFHISCMNPVQEYLFKAATDIAYYIFMVMMMTIKEKTIYRRKPNKRLL